MSRPRLSVAVMAHPARGDAATVLAAGLDATIVWDQGGGEWETGAAAWQAHDLHATHHLVVQDDALPCRDLPAGVVRALPRLPAADLMSLYFGNASRGAGRPGSHPLVAKAAAEAARQQASWLIVPGAWWGVALVAPVEAIGPMLAWCADRREPYDMRIAYWCQSAGRNVWHTWPSLVDHHDGPSLVRPGRQRGRRAWRWAGAEASALTFDPAGPVVRVGSNRRATTTPQAPSGLHDPHWQRQRRRQLTSYLQRRRRAGTSR